MRDNQRDNDGHGSRGSTPLRCVEGAHLLSRAVERWAAPPLTSPVVDGLRQTVCGARVGHPRALSTTQWPHALSSDRAVATPSDLPCLDHNLDHGLGHIQGLAGVPIAAARPSRMRSRSRLALTHRGSKRSRLRERLQVWGLWAHRRPTTTQGRRGPQRHTASRYQCP